MKLSNINKNNKIYLFLVFAFTLFFTLHYGYRGVLPIDSFLIFDAGYKILNGVHPFKDYWSITGPLLDYLQYTIFYLLDVSWFSYILHAALVNCLLSILSFYFFVKFGLSKFFSLVYATGISILAYPSIGSPFVDHHAVIFSLISVYFLILAFKEDKKKFWFFSSFSLALSFFSKQIPSAYLGILLLSAIILYLLYFKKKQSYNFLFFLLGGSTIVIIFLSIFITNEIPIKNFLVQYIYYPMSIGNDRILNLKYDFNNTVLQFKIIYISIIPLLVLNFFLLIKNNKKEEDVKNIFILTLAFVSALLFIYVQLLTRNQILIFFLIPFYLGLTHLYVNKYYNKKLLIFLIIALFFFSTTKYHLRFNQYKKFMDLEKAKFNKSIDFKVFDEKLSKLMWLTNEYIENPSIEIEILNEVKDKLIEDKENKIIITDYQFFPAIIKNKFFAPNKWFDDLSVPKKNNKYFQIYKTFFISKLKANEIKNIYIIGSDKPKYILVLFDDKKCISQTKINDVFLKLSIDNCFK